MAQQITYTVNVETDKATQQVDQLDTSIEGLNDTATDTKKVGDSFNAMPGPIGKAKGAVAGLSAGFKLLLANPVVLVITAIVGTLTLLFKAFTSTKEGGEKMSQVMAGLGAVMDVLRDVLVKLTKNLIETFKNPQQALEDFAELIKENIVNRFEGLLKLLPRLGKAIGLLFKGEFAEAGKVASDALLQVTLGVENFSDKAAKAFEKVKEIVNEGISEGKIAAQVEAALQRVADAERALTIERAKQNKVIAEARLLAEDETLALEERIAAVELAAKLEGELSDKELQVQKQRAAAIALRNSLSDSSIAQLDEEAQAIARVFDLETASLSKRKRLATEIESLRNEAATNEKARIKELDDARIASDKAADIQRKKTVDAINALHDKRIKDAKDQKDIDDAVAANKVAVTTSALTALQGLVGDDSRFGKAIAVTSAIIDTWRGATKALGQGGTFGFVGAAAVVATGFANVRNILATNTPDAPMGGGGGGGGSIGSAPSIGPSVGIIESQLNPNSQIVSALSNAIKKPPKAFVVSQNVSTQAGLDRHIQQNATLGG